MRSIGHVPTGAVANADPNTDASQFVRECLCPFAGVAPSNGRSWFLISPLLVVFFSTFCAVGDPNIYNTRCQEASTAQHLTRNGCCLLWRQLDNGMHVYSVRIPKTSEPEFQLLGTLPRLRELHIALSIKTLGDVGVLSGADLVTLFRTVGVYGPRPTGPGTAAGDSGDRDLRVEEKDTDTSETTAYNRLRNIVSQCVELERLTLWNIEVRDTLLEEFYNMSKLEELAVRSSIPITENGWKEIATLGNLERLTVSASTEERELSPLAELPNLKSIELRGLSLSGHTVPTLLGLEEVHLRHCTLSPGALRALAGLPKLHTLSLAHCTTHGRDAASSALDGLVASRNLQTLALVCGEFADASLEPLSRVEALRNFELRGRRERLVGLERLNGLECLRLENVSVVAERLAPLRSLRKLQVTRSRLVGAIPTFPALEELDISGSKVESGFIHSLAGSKISQLCLADIRSITAKDIKSLSGLKNLVELDVSRTNISDTGLRELGLHSHLEVLRMRDTGTDDSSMRHIGGMDSLEILDLSSSSISDEGLHHIIKCARLRELNLADVNNLTDEGLLTLNSLRSLRRIDVSGTKVTGAGIMACRIGWVASAVCYAGGGTAGLPSTEGGRERR